MAGARRTASDHNVRQGGDLCDPVGPVRCTRVWFTRPGEIPARFVATAVSAGGVVLCCLAGAETGGIGLDRSSQ